MAYETLLERGADKTHWLDVRAAARGIGGSEIGPLLGLSPFATALDIWASKTMDVHAPETPAMRVGTVLEPGIITLALEHLNELEAGWELDPDAPMLARSEEHPIALMSPDAVAVHEDGRRCLIEAKATSTNMSEAPPTYVAQIRWGVGVLGCDFGLLAAVNGSRFITHRVAPDDWWFKTTAEFAQEWWERHIENDEMPDIDVVKNEALVASLFAPEKGTRVEVPSELAVRAKDAYDTYKASEKAWNASKAEMALAMGDMGDIATVGNEKVATYSVSQTTGLDQKRLKAEHPGLWAEYSKTSQRRTFRWSK